MRLRILVIPLTVCAVAAAVVAAILWPRPGPATATAPVDLTGRWLAVTTTTFPVVGLTNSCDVRVIQTDKQINGSIACGGLLPGTLSGKITGPDIVLDTTSVGEETSSWEGTIHSADKITGTWILDTGVTGTFVATRQPVPMTITSPDTGRQRRLLLFASARRLRQPGRQLLH